MLGEVIYYHRIKSGITQEELAKGICSVSYLSKLENNKLHPSDVIVEQLCATLGISIEDIHAVDFQLRNLLNDWKESILLRNVELATERKSQVEILMANKKNSPCIVRMATILEFGYHLLVKDSEKALDTQRSLEGMYRFFDSAQKYLYHQFKGLMHYASNEIHQSLQDLQTALEIGDGQQLAGPELYYQLALVYTRLYHVHASLHFAEKAMNLFHGSSDFLRGTECKILLGINHIRLQNADTAKVHLLSALKAAKSYHNQNLISIVLHNLGYLHSIIKERQKAISYYLECLQYRDQRDYKRLINSIYFLAKEYYLSAEHDKALDWIQKGLAMAIENDLEPYRIKLAYLRHHVVGMETDEFIDFMEQYAIPFFSKIGDSHYISEYAETLADLFSKRFQYKKSSHYYSMANEARKKINGVCIEL